MKTNIILILILLSPIIEILLEQASPVYGTGDAFKVEKSRNKFYFTDKIGCIDNLTQIPDECYAPTKNRYQFNRPHILSLDKKPMRFIYFQYQMLFVLAHLEDLAFNSHMNPGCNFADLHNDTARSLYQYSEEYINTSKLVEPESQASSFFPSTEAITDKFQPNLFTNYQVKISDNTPPLYLEMLLGWIYLADTRGGLASMLYYDNCTAYRNSRDGKVIKSGIPASEIREDFTDYLSDFLNSMEYYESIVEGELTEGILYFSYYSELEKALLIVKAPKQILNNAIVKIDSMPVEHEYRYPVYYIHTEGLDDGWHNITVSNHSLEFDVSYDELLAEAWVLNDNEILFTMTNYYDEDVTVEYIQLLNNGEVCKYNGSAVIIRHNPEPVLGKSGYYSHNRSVFNISCIFPDNDRKYMLDYEIKYQVGNSSRTNNGFVYSSKY